MSLRSEATTAVTILAIGLAGAGIRTAVESGPTLPPIDGNYTAPVETGERDATSDPTPTPPPTPEPAPVEGTYLPSSWTSQLAALVARDTPSQDACLDQVAEQEARALALSVLPKQVPCSSRLFIVTTATASIPIPATDEATDVTPEQAARAVRRDVNDHITRVGVAGYSYDGRIYVAVVGSVS